jgi:3D-(3,5/4)-trihydroxycyclohexane-1,2-dione acylhydrolase (decyclizing)
MSNAATMILAKQQNRLREHDPHNREGDVHQRARAIHKAGGLAQALATGALPNMVRVSLSEALILGLLKQGVSTYFAIFGHGSTDIANILRIYEQEGVTRTLNCRNEVEMAHAATSLRWTYGVPSAVITSIGPGALQAMAGSLAAASNGVGVYHIYGDETTWGEGYNMQQVPKPQQGLYGRMTADLNQSYVLHTPQALREALRRGVGTVFHPYKAGPFYLMMPINTQPQQIDVNLSALPEQPAAALMGSCSDVHLREAAQRIHATAKVIIKAGGGVRGHDNVIRRLAHAAGAAVVLSPGSTGVLPESDPLNMHVGGSKGSISGNYAMSEAELVIVIGSRAVCQSDCSGIGYPSAQHVININGDLADVMHYNHTTALVGDLALIAERLAIMLEGMSSSALATKQAWLNECLKKKNEWRAFRDQRLAHSTLFDAVWQRPALTQPAALHAVAQFAQAIKAVKYFDAGDVQANGFQIVEDERTGDTITETGASYMGFATSALLASAAAPDPRYPIAFTGDGSFMMNPQILIDAAEHGVHGMIVIFDNCRMAAITGLQHAQYGHEFKTHDGVAVDYVQLASAVRGVKALHGGWSVDELTTALHEGYAHEGLSVIHVPVYAGQDPLGGLGAWGSWNVGNWCDDVQQKWLHQSI